MVSANVGPDPLRRELAEQHVYEHRSLFCARYDACLDEAVRREWPSWTCAHCPCFEARAPAPAGADDAPHLNMSAARPSRAALRARTIPASGPAAGSAGAASARPADAPRSTRASVDPEDARDEAPVRPTSGPALFIAAAREVARASGAPTREGASNHEEVVAISAPDADSLLDRWIDELALRSRRSNARFTEFDIVYLSERQLVASVRGVRALEPERTAVALSP